jgi:hypothetical protein
MILSSLSPARTAAAAALSQIRQLGAVRLLSSADGTKARALVYTNTNTSDPAEVFPIFAPFVNFHS